MSSLVSVATELAWSHLSYLAPEGGLGENPRLWQWPQQQDILTGHAGDSPEGSGSNSSNSKEAPLVLPWRAGTFGTRWYCGERGCGRTAPNSLGEAGLSGIGTGVKWRMAAMSVCKLEMVHISGFLSDFTPGQLCPTGRRVCGLTPFCLNLRWLSRDYCCTQLLFLQELHILQVC